MRGLREEIPLLREKIASLDSSNKVLAEIEAKSGNDFIEMIGNPMQNPLMCSYYRIFGDGKTHISNERFKMEAMLHEIKEEWKPLENDDLHEIKSKQDKANRLISDYTYYTKKNMVSKATEKMAEYELASAELIDMIHTLRVKKESQLPGFLVRVAQAEAAFFRACAQYAEQVESQLRYVGPINPIPNQYSNTYQSNTNQSNSYQQGPPPISRNSVTARAVFQFQAESREELSFKVGDILTIRSQQGEWWTAEINGKSGLIPANYVQLL